MVQDWSCVLRIIMVDLHGHHERNHAAGKECALTPPLLAQPLAGSWQERVKAAKRAEKRAAKKAAKAAADNGVDLGVLSKGLPTGWQAMLDATSGDVYYGNLSTKVGAGFCWCTNRVSIRLCGKARLAAERVPTSSEVDHLVLRCTAVCHAPTCSLR